MRLDTIADDLAAGRIELWQLPAWAFELWNAGYWARDPELAELERRLAQAEADADRYFELWRNPGQKLAEARQRRIEQALDAASHEGLTEEQQLVIMMRAAEAPRRAA